MKRYNMTKENEMKERHSLEKRRLPKILKSEAKTRAQMFKQSLRLSTIGTPEEDKVKIKQVSVSDGIERLFTAVLQGLPVYSNLMVIPRLYQHGSCNSLSD